MLAEAQSHPNRQQAWEDRGQAQCPQISSEKGLRQEEKIKVQRSMVVRRIVAEIARPLHLIGEPPVDALVEMRRLDVKKRNPQAGRDDKNSNVDPGKLFQPAGHAIGIVSDRALFKSRQKAPDPLQDMLVDLLLGLIACSQPALGKKEGVVAAIHDQHLIGRPHLRANRLKERQRT